MEPREDFGSVRDPWGLPEWFDWAVRSSWLRWVLLGIVVLIAALGAINHFVVAPQQTSVLFQLKIAGTSQSVNVIVDPESGEVAFTGRESAPTDIRVREDSILVEVEQAGERSVWLQIDPARFSDRWSGLNADDVELSLRRGSRVCNPPDETAVVVFEVAFGASAAAEIEWLCGRGTGAAAIELVTVLVSGKDVRPVSEIDVDQIITPTDTSYDSLLVGLGDLRS